MIKAIDDNWEYVSGGWPYDVFRKGTNEKVADVWGFGIEDTHAAADIIAAAPEMVRMLQKAEWAMGGHWGPSGDDSCDTDYACPICFGEKPNHEKDCRLEAVLRKAGVIADKETR